MSFTKFLSRLTSSNMEVNGDKQEEKDDTIEGSSDEGKSTSINNNDASATGVSGNKTVSGRKRFGENGFEEQGGYMAAKRAKLDNQFNLSTRTGSDTANTDSLGGSEIFKDVSVYINGYTNPPEPELRELFIRHGGTYHSYHSLTNTTHVIATNLSAPSKRLYARKTIKPDWIMDSIAAGKILDTRNYMLYDMNEEKNQKTLDQFVRPKANESSLTKSTSALNDLAAQAVSGEAQDANIQINLIPETFSLPQMRKTTSTTNANSVEDSDSEEFFECSQDLLNSSPNKPSPRMSSEARSPNLNSESEKPESNSNPQKKEVVNLVNAPNPFAKKSPGKTGKIKTATDDGFIEDFFGRSRLHLISEQKKEMQLYIGNLRKNLKANENEQNFPNLKKFKEEMEAKKTNEGDPDADPQYSVSDGDGSVVLMHIDLDCFFVSVGLLNRPHLRGKPVVVTHSTGKAQESRSDIACASYEARKFGVHNGMWVGEAKEKCPSLEVIPYDFEEYRRVSKLFFQAVASITLDVEPNSVDEMVVDVTSVLKHVACASPQDLAEFFRKIILSETQCPASVGIGSNKLLAKLAVKLAKPDGIQHLKDSEASAYIQSLNVRDLPGVGWSNEGKLRESFQVETCSDLLNVPLNELKSAFGEKTAEKLHNLCRGIDTAEIKFGLERPKSISVDVNFGIRFQKEEDVTNFLANICKELSNRAEKVEAISCSFTLKLMIRRKGAGEPLKQGGHGIVDCVTRSRKLLNPTRNWNELYKIACSLIRAARYPPTDYRGVGVSLNDLKFDCDKQNNKKCVQRTLMDMPLSSRTQKMLTLTLNKNKGTAAGGGSGPALIFSNAKRQNSDSSSVNGSHDLHENDCNNVAVQTNSSGDSGVMSKSNDQNNPGNGDSSEMQTVNQVNGSSESEQLIWNGTERSKQKQGMSSVSTSTASGTGTDHPSVDINVLRQLPRDIAEEQCQIYGISKEMLDQVEPDITSVSAEQGGSADTGNYYETIDTVDQSFLLALPENVRHDVLLQLQEAKGSKGSGTEKAKPLQLDDQQPCSSRQALERNRMNEELLRHNENEPVPQSEFSENQNQQVNKPSTSPTKSTATVAVAEVNKEGEHLSLEEQTTPVIVYTSNKNEIPPTSSSTKNAKFDAIMDPKNFWNDNVDCVLLPPRSVTLPALNNRTDIAEVRNLIRQGLELVTEPTQDDVRNLEKYFRLLISDCWLEQAQVLLKFLYRQIKMLPPTSKWIPWLTKLIEESQALCIQLHGGAIQLE